MKHLFPLALLLLVGCEQAPAPDYAPKAQQAHNARRSESVESYVRGYAQYEQCLWGHGICAVAVTELATTSTGEISQRTPRVRLSLVKDKLEMRFLSPFDPAVNVITIHPGEEFFIAQPETEALGAHALKVKKGAYRIDRSWGEYGGVRLTVQRY